MSSAVNQFPVIQSMPSRWLTFLIKGFGLCFSVLIPILLVVMTVMVYRSGRIAVEIKILMTVITILLACFFRWCLVTQKKGEKKNKITRIAVDDKGLHHYSGEELVRSMNYSALISNPENEKYDVFLYQPGDTDPDVCVYLFDRASDKPMMKTVSLDASFVIVNGRALIVHFLKGIMTFRPDLKIAPNVLDLFKVKEQENEITGSGHKAPAASVIHL